jgi:hypothetical protein
MIVVILVLTVFSLKEIMLDQIFDWVCHWIKDVLIKKNFEEGSLWKHHHQEYCNHRSRCHRTN